MWSKNLSFALSVALLTVAACGIDNLGVRSVTFGLSPTPVSEIPEGVDAEILAVVALSSGNVSVHTDDGDGVVMVEGLAPLAAEFSYLAMLQFAHDERADIPGGVNDDDLGHSHGAISLFDGSAADSADAELTTVALGVLAIDEGGHWGLEFGPDDVLPHSFGALRGAMIMLSAPGGASMLMFGEVSAENDAAGDTAAEEGGHSHGP